MRSHLAMSALGATLMLTNIIAASAQQTGTYCLLGSGTGTMNCSFATMAQCQAAMTGTITERCIRNPNSDEGIPAPR
jgi:hypothetical protein